MGLKLLHPRQLRSSRPETANRSGIASSLGWIFCMRMVYLVLIPVMRIILLFSSLKFPFPFLLPFNPHLIHTFPVARMASFFPLSRNGAKFPNAICTIPVAIFDAWRPVSEFGVYHSNGEGCLCNTFISQLELAYKYPTTRFFHISSRFCLHFVRSWHSRF